MFERNRWAGRSLLLIFAASGFAGLIYESIWTQYLGLILGHSAYAQVLVLALFMGGMALGAWLISSRSALLKQPLMNYAIVEFVLGVFGVGFHAYYGLISGWAYNTLFPALSPGLPLEMARWSIAALLIFPQCILLGMTFPLMSAGYIRQQPSSSGNILAGLYFSNSIGAATGAMVATFVLLPWSGLPGTVLTGGIISIFVAMAIWPLTKSEQPIEAFAEISRPNNLEQSVPGFILLMAAITGASSFIYEITWVRMLSMVLGGTIHAFEIMLSAFITGLALGGLWLRKRADRLVSPRRAAGWAQVAMGCFALSTLFLYNDSFEWLAWVMKVLNRSAESSYTLYNIASSVIAMIIMLPTAFFAGMTLPLLTLTLLRGGTGESAIGKVYASNTLGAIVGVILAVFVGLPLLGLRLTLWAGAAADIVIGLFLLSGLLSKASERPASSRWSLPVIATTCAILLTVALTQSTFDPQLMSSTVYRHGFLDRDKNSKVLYHADGRTASVTLRQIGVNEQRSIFTNGKPDAAISFEGKPAADEITMMAAGTIPMMHHPKARSVAVVGFGSGMTTHFVLGNPNIELVDTIEIEPEMVEAARHFRPIVERAYTDPRSHIVIDDAKSYFATNHKRYDIIVSEPSNPWVNGVASLFTDEFYAFVPKHLNEGGIFAQWVQAYEISPALISSIVRAMAPHFVDIHLYAAGGSDWLLVASPSRKLTDINSLTIPKDWSPEIYSEMATRGIAGINDVSILFSADKSLLLNHAALYRSTGINSDFFPILQLAAARTRFNNSNGTEIGQLRMANWPVFEVLTGIRLDKENPEPSPSLAKHENYPLAVALLTAQQITLALDSRPEIRESAAISNDNRVAVEYLRSASETCRLEHLGNDGLNMLAWLATLTVPYLSTETGQEVWKTTRWLKCPAKAPLLVNLLQFIQALAARNYEAVYQFGSVLLSDPQFNAANSPALSPAVNYVIGGTQLAAFALGKYSEMKSIGTGNQKRLAQTISRRILESISSKRLEDAGNPPQVAR